MECIFEQRESPCFKTVYHNEKKSLVTVESVVPEANGDIGQIAFVEADCFLKGKEYNGRGYTVQAQLEASVFCLPETEDRLESLHISKEFELEFEFPEAHEGQNVDIALLILNREARTLNPRKISLSCEVAAEFSCRESSSFPVCIMPPESCETSLHILPGEGETRLCTSVMEKQFTVQDQMLLKEKAAEQGSVLGKTLQIRADEATQLGKRLIVKGCVELRAWTAASDGLPVLSEAELPFSQVLDLDDDTPCEFSICAQPTACYLDLSENIRGESVLDAEIHGVLQVCVSHRMALEYAQDAYSNRYEIALSRQQIPLNGSAERKKRTLQAEDSFPLEEGCRVVACAYSVSEGENEGRAVLAILLENNDGKLSLLRRSLTLSADALPENAVAGHAKLRSFSTVERAKELRVTVRAEQEVSIPNASCAECIVGAEWDESKALSEEGAPSITLLITEGESAWELAKRCHSTVEAIQKANPEFHGEARTRLLIPRTQ